MKKIISKLFPKKSSELARSSELAPSELAQHPCICGKLEIFGKLEINGKLEILVNSKYGKLEISNQPNFEFTYSREIEMA